MQLMSWKCIKDGNILIIINDREGGDANYEYILGKQEFHPPTEGEKQKLLLDLSETPAEQSRGDSRKVRRPSGVPTQLWSPCFTFFCQRGRSAFSLQSTAKLK